MNEKTNYIFKVTKISITPVIIISQFAIKLSILVIFLIPSLTAQTTLSLSKAVERGLKNNFDVQIERINMQMAANQLNAAKKERLPQVNLNGSQENNFINDRSPTSFINEFYRDRRLSVGIDGSWLAFDAFQGKINKQRYNKLKEISEGKEQLVIENSIYSILLAYYNALLQKEAVSVARQSLKLSVERYKDAQLQQQLGQVSTYDVIRFENATLIDSSKIVIQKKELDAAMIALNQAMGNKKTISYSLSDPLSYVPQTYELTQLRRQLDSNNKTLNNRYKNLEVLQLNTEAERKSALPTLSINTGLSQGFNGTSFPEESLIKSNTFQYYLRFSANYNLLDGGANKRAVEEKELLEQIEYLQIEQIKTSLADELTSNIASYNRQLELVQINERLLENVDKNIKLEKDRYSNGFSSALDYRTVQMEYINAQFTRLEAIYELLKNEIEILRLTGKLMNRNF